MARGLNGEQTKHLIQVLDAAAAFTCAGASVAHVSYDTLVEAIEDADRALGQCRDSRGRAIMPEPMQSLRDPLRRGRAPNLDRPAADAGRSEASLQDRPVPVSILGPHSEGGE